jgi:nitroreductase
VENAKVRIPAEIGLLHSIKFCVGGETEFYMDFFDVIQARRSVRSYKPDEVEAEKLQKILEAARIAPTAANRQAFKVVVVKTKGHEEQLKRIYNRDWFVQPPLVLAVCSVKGGYWVRSDGRAYSDVDAGIVMDHIILAATALGLGTCWIGAFNEQAAIELLELGDGLEPVVLAPLGYADDKPRERVRKAIDNVIIYK